MERLTETPFFKLLSADLSADSNRLITAYREFAFTVITMSKEAIAEIPAYFTFNYTLFELNQLQKQYGSLKGEKKKCGKTYFP